MITAELIFAQLSSMV